VADLILALSRKPLRPFTHGEATASQPRLQIVAASAAYGARQVRQELITGCRGAVHIGEIRGRVPGRSWFSAPTGRDSHRWIARPTLPCRLDLHVFPRRSLSL
jgi:hypothetical protein